jgi:ribosomal protein S18 acetylase RimI-like enzyme
MEQISIESLKESDLHEAATIAARAYAANPDAVAVYRNHPDQFRLQEASFMQTFGQAPEIVSVAKKDERVVGVMRMVEWPQCQMSLARMWKIVPIMVIRMRGLAVRRFIVMNNWSKHHPKEPHWHLGPIAIVPEMQGQGIGSQLLEHFCKHVDQDGQAAYLETDKPENVPLYERFGFLVTEDTIIINVQNWFMWRAKG